MLRLAKMFQKKAGNFLGTQQKLAGCLTMEEGAVAASQVHQMGETL